MNVYCSAIQRLKHDKSLKVQDIIKPSPDYSSPCERIKLFFCGIFLLISITIFSSTTLFAILSKAIDFDISNDMIRAVPLAASYEFQLMQILTFLQNDWHYCLLIPILFPLSVILGWFGWIGFKLYRHN